MAGAAAGPRAVTSFNPTSRAQGSSFTITNPGTLLVSVRQYYEGGISICRNKALQRMFGYLGGAEQAGSGADKIVKGWESAHWMRPYLDVRDEPDRVTLELEMESILSVQAQERLQQVFGERTETLFGDWSSPISSMLPSGMNALTARPEQIGR